MLCNISLSIIIDLVGRSDPITSSTGAGIDRNPCV